jgi:hypothetical protein
MDDERFDLVGSSKYWVDVDASSITLTLSSLAAPLSISIDRVAAVVRQTEVEADPTLYRRRERIVDLTGRDANALIVFDSSLFVPPLKYGAEQTVTVSKRERKSGLNVDGLGLTFEDPDRFVARLVERGVPAMSRRDALSKTIGIATGDDVARRAGERRSAATKLRRYVVGLSMAMAALLAWRFGLSAQPTVGFWSSQIQERVILTAVMFVASVIVAGSVVPTAMRRRPVRGRRSAGEVALRLGPVVVVVAFAIWRATVADATTWWVVLLDSVISGGLPGAGLGYIWKKTVLPPASTSPFV